MRPQLHILAGIVFILIFSALIAAAQIPPIEPGVSGDLARWRAAHYSDIRYKLNLTLEKMSPVLKGTIEIRVTVGEKGSRGAKEMLSPGTPSRSSINSLPTIAPSTKTCGSKFSKTSTPSSAP